MKDEILEHYRIVLIAISTNVISFAIGNFMGWTSPMMPKLVKRAKDSPLSYKITNHQEGWLGSLGIVGAFSVPIFIRPLTSLIGRRKALLLFSTLFLVSYVFYGLGHNLWIFYIARYIQGFSAGGSASVVPMYIAEISPDSIRGALGSLMTIFVVSGMLYSFILGPYVNYYVFQLCCAFIPSLFFVIFFFMPESPYHYAIKGNEEELITCLLYLHGRSYTKVAEESAKILFEVNRAMKNKSRLIDVFQNRTYRRALLIAMGLMWFHELTGNTPITFYSQQIFSSATTVMDPALGTIMLGFVQMGCNLCTMFFIDKSGRKIILSISAIGMAISLLTLAVFFYLKEKKTMNTSWIPIPFLIMFKASYGFGFGPVVWAVMAEMFPPNIKPIATATVCSTSWFLAILTARIFPEFLAVGEYFPFFIFAGCCCCAFFFVRYLVMETKGLSLQMIQENLEHLGNSTR